MTKGSFTYPGLAPIEWLSLHGVRSWPWHHTVYAGDPLLWPEMRDLPVKELKPIRPSLFVLEIPHGNKNLGAHF